MEKNTKFMIFYCIGIFLFAGILLIISYQTQVRVNQELSASKEIASGAQTQLEQVTATNSELRTENNTLKGELETTKTDLNAMAKKAEANNLFWKIIKNYYRKDRDTALLAGELKDFMDKGLKQYLDEEQKKELEDIIKKTQ